MTNHDIKTIKQLVKVANEDNLDNLMIDLKTWMKYMVGVRKLKSLGVIPQIDTFRWIDDGKHEETFSFKVVKEKQK